MKKGAAFCVPKAKYWSLFPRASTVEEAAAKTRCKVREAAVQCRVCRLQSQSYILLILIRSGGSSGLGMETTDKKTASQNSVRWHGQNDGQINPQMKTAKTTPFIELSQWILIEVLQESEIPSPSLTQLLKAKYRNLNQDADLWSSCTLWGLGSCS